MGACRKKAGFTLVELAVVVALIGIFAAMAIPNISQWTTHQRLKGAARDVGNVFTIARSQAIRTGNNHVVFFMAPAISTQDPRGNDLLNQSGVPSAVLVLNDGPAAGANCSIDLGEVVTSVPLTPGLNWGVTNATLRAPLDTALPPITDGLTFTNPISPANARSWVLFRRDGIPVGFSGDVLTGCGTIGGTGTGGGTGYVTDGNRDYAVVLTPLGGVRLHAWDETRGQWTN